MKERSVFIRRGTQHEVRATEIARRGLKKVGFELQKRRSLTEPLIVIAETEGNLKQFKERMEGYEIPNEAAVLDDLLNNEWKGTHAIREDLFSLPSTVTAHVNIVGGADNRTYEIDFFQDTSTTHCVSDDQIIPILAPKQES